MSSLKESIFYQAPLPVQNWLVSRLGKGLAKKRYGMPFDELLESIAFESSLSRDEVTARSFQRLKQILVFASTEIPHYKRIFQEHGIVPESFRYLDDLEKIPPLDKEQLRNNPQSFLPTDFKQRSYFLQNTSGTTGKPLTLHVDESTYKLAMALLVHHERCHGVAQGEPRATFAGRMIQRPDDNRGPFCRYNSAENQMIFSSYHISEKTYPVYEEQLNKFKPVEIIGYPSAIAAMAHLVLKSGRELKFRPRIVVTNSETLLANQREVIEKAFDCPVADYYGTAEYVTFAGQCTQGAYHVYPSLGLLEVVDESDRVLRNGEGEILCTSLSNRAMPLIRYRIGDRAIASEKSCSCDSPHPVIASFEGRIDDVVISEDGKRIGRLDHIYKGMSGILEAQLIQKKADLCLIKVVKSSESDSIREALLVSNLKDRVGKSMRVDIQYVNEIPKGKNGKFKAVVSELPALKKS